MTYQCEYFQLEELIPKETYLAHRDKCWMLFDERLLRALDLLRDQFGPMIINTWKNGGVYQYRGWRPPEYKLCAPFSQHFFGRAADINFNLYTASAVRTWMQLNYKTVLEPKGCVIKRIENNTSWLHIDVGNTNSDGIVYFNP